MTGLGRVALRGKKNVTSDSSIFQQMPFRTHLILKVFSVFVILSVSFIPSLSSLSSPCHVFLQISHLHLSLPSHMLFFPLLALSLPAAPPPLPSPSTSLSVLLSSLISRLFHFQLSQRWLIRRIYRRTDWIIRVNQEWWRSLSQSVDFVIPAEWELGPVATADRHIQKLTLWRKGCFAW